MENIDIDTYILNIMADARPDWFDEKEIEKEKEKEKKWEDAWEEYQEWEWENMTVAERNGVFE